MTYNVYVNGHNGQAFWQTVTITREGYRFIADDRYASATLSGAIRQAIAGSIIYFLPS